MSESSARPHPIESSLMSPLRVLVFLLVAISVLGGLHYYVWARLVRDTRIPEPWALVATLALAALCALVILGFVLRRTTSLLATPVAWGAYTWLGLLFLLFVLLAVTDAAGGSIRLVRHVLEVPPLDPARRDFFVRVLGGAVGIGALGMAGLGVINVLRPVTVKRVQVPIGRLAKNAAGLRIVQLSDVHVGPTIGKEFLEAVVARVNALEPDVIAITGDLVDGSVADLRELVAPLGDLRAKHGVYFVTGNHEYYSGVDDWLAHLPTLGIRVLHNEHVSIGGDGGIDLAGVDDWSAHGFGGGHGPDLPRALEGRDSSRPLVLLAHQPKQIEEAAQLGVDLQLSGHTHGGQIFPWGFLVRLTQPYLAGLHKHREAHVYVSEGTGYWGPPMRIGTTAEITHLELVAA